MTCSTRFTSPGILSCVGLILVVAACLATPVFATDPSPGMSLKEAARRLRDLQDGAVDKGEKQCGVNCLYLFLKLHGLEPRFSDVEALVPIGEHGASLQSLAEASRKLGLRALPVLSDPADWSKVSLPAIAHMERFGETEPYLHYVVITNVTPQGVDLFDPFDSRTRFFNYSQLGTVFSGYSLVAAPHPLAQYRVALAFLGAVFAALGLLGVARHRVRHLTEKPRAASAITALFVLSWFLTGCNRSDREATVGKSQEQIQSGPQTELTASPIHVENTVVDLGELPYKSVVQGEFRFRNTSSKPLVLRVGPTNCSCLKAVVSPDQPLAPGAEGRLTLHLDTARKNEAGKIESCASLIVGDEQFLQKFCLHGVLEGVVFQNKMYVVRPGHRTSNRIPKLEFAVVGRDVTDFQISRITCTSLPEFARLVTGGDRVQTDAATPSGPLTAVLNQASVSAPLTPTGESFSVRKVEVPMDLAEASETYGGTIIIDYVLAGREFQAMTRLLVVGTGD